MKFIVLAVDTMRYFLVRCLEVRSCEAKNYVRYSESHPVLVGIYCGFFLPEEDEVLFFKRSTIRQPSFFIICDVHFTSCQFHSIIAIVLASLTACRSPRSGLHSSCISACNTRSLRCICVVHAWLTNILSSNKNCKILANAVQIRQTVVSQQLTTRIEGGVS